MDKAPKHPFDYHSPNATQIEQIQKVREGCKALHATLLELPGCRERSVAITRLEEVSMWANKGIIMVDEGPVAPAGTRVTDGNQELPSTVVVNG